jgi:hypothetical protein
MASSAYRDNVSDLDDDVQETQETQPVGQSSYQAPPQQGYEQAPYQQQAPAPYGQPVYQGPPQYVPQPQPQWQQPQWQQPGPSHQSDGRGFDMGEFTRQHIRTPETKEFFKTSEFAAFVLAVAAILVASVIDNGFDAFEAWTLVTAATVGYMINRGLSKAGARRDYPHRDRNSR